MEYLLFSDNTDAANDGNSSLFTFNLTKSQKLLTKLKKYVDKVRSESPEYFYKVDSNKIAVYETPEQILLKLEAEKQSLQTQFVNNALVVNDFFKLKTLIQTQNALSGINVILSEIECLQQMQKNYEKYLSEFSSTTIRNIGAGEVQFIVDDSNLAANKSDWNARGASINTSIFNKNEIDVMIAKISKRLDHLETNRDQTNATTQLHISLSTATIVYLGL